MAAVATLLVKIGADLKDLEKSLGQAQRHLEDFGKHFHETGKALSKTLTAPIVGFGVLTLRTAADFETAMNKVAAISQATTGELEQMKQVARELGATTQFSASDAADGMSFLAMAGFKVNEIIGAMPTVLNLAAVAQLDMATAADIASNIMAGFSMSADELSGAVDVLSKAMTSSNTNLQQLGDAMKFVGPVASSFGIQFEETAAAVGFLSDAGLQASTAGTGLRRILTTVAQRADDLGVKAFDAAGNMLPLADIIEQIEQSGLTAARAMEIFGDRGGPAMQVLLSRGSAALREMTADLEDSGGTAERIAKVQMQGLNGAIEELKSAWEELQLTVADSGALEAATQAVTRLFEAVGRLAQWFGDLDKETQTVILRIAAFAAGIGPVLMAIGKLGQGISKLIGLVRTLTAAQIALNTAQKANVFIALAAAAALLVDRVRTAQKETRRLNDLIKDGLHAPATGAEEDIERMQAALDAVNKKIVDTVKLQRSMGVEGSAAAERQLAPLITQRDQLAYNLMEAQRLHREMTEGAEQSVDAVDGVTDSFEELAHRVDRVRIGAGELNNELVDTLALAEFRKLSEETAEFNNALYKVLTTSYELGPALELPSESIEEVSKSFVGLEMVAGQVFDRLAFGAERLDSVLKSIVRQLASRAVMTALRMVFGGGGTVGGLGGFLKSVIGVNDALITSRGQIVQFHPNDSILAMQDFSGLGGGPAHVTVEGAIRGDIIHLANARGSRRFR